MSVEKKNKFKSFALKLCAGGITVIVAGLIYLYGTPKIYRATAKVKLIKSGWKTNDTSFSFGPERLPEECQVIRSELVLDRAITNLELNTLWAKRSGQDVPLKTEQTRQRLKAMLDVHPAPNAFMIDIQASGSDPVELAKIVNGVTRSYCDLRQTGREEASREGFNSLQAKWETQSEKVEEAQAAVNNLAAQFNAERQQFNREHSTNPTAIYDASAAESLQVKRLEVEDEYTKKSDQLAQLKAIDKDELKNVLSSMDTNSLLAGALRQLIKAKGDLRDARAAHGADAPETRSASLAVDQLSHRVDGLVDSTMSMRELELTSLKAIIERMKGMTATAARPPTNDLNRFAEQDAAFTKAKENLEKLTEEREQLKLEIIGNSSLNAALPSVIAAQIVDLADPSAKPTSPDRRIAIGAFALGGILAGLGLLLLVLLQAKPRGAEERAP